MQAVTRTVGRHLPALNELGDDDPFVEVPIRPGLHIEQAVKGAECDELPSDILSNFRYTILVRRTLPTTFLIAITLFPIGWLGTLSPGLDNFGDAFATARAHAIGHAILFAGLASFFYAYFPRLRVDPLLFVLLVLLLAVGQELGQLLYKQRPLVFDDYRDVAVDMIAAISMWVVARALTWAKRRATAVFR